MITMKTKVEQVISDQKEVKCGCKNNSGQPCNPAPMFHGKECHVFLEWKKSNQ